MKTAAVRIETVDLDEYPCTPRLRGACAKNAISVECYNHDDDDDDIELGLAMSASLSMSQTSTHRDKSCFIDVEESGQHCTRVRESFVCTPIKCLSSPSVFEIGESSNSSKNGLERSPIYADSSKPQTTRKRKRKFIDLEEEEDCTMSLFETSPSTDEDRQLAGSVSLCKSQRIRKFSDEEDCKMLSSEAGECSKSSKTEFLCNLCVETKSVSECFRIKGCSHAYCRDCTIKYVGSQLQDKKTTLTCPESGCGGYLEPENCQYILPREVFERWCELLCEAMVIGSQKFYCPFKDCSALLVRDGGKMMIKESECPTCRRLFCAQCKVSWHAGILCEEFQKLNKNDREKEEKKRWKICPNCRFYVAKTNGCNLMKCRCRTIFCYTCRGVWGQTSHVSCRQDDE